LSGDLGSKLSAFHSNPQYARLGAKPILDPINSTTGNFYYTKDNIVIPGRYPLVFKRFYNSVGGMDGVLGINWTHNYNIRLYNNEENIHIVFDDGHAETYKRLDNGMYAAPADRHNVLIADENGGFCLHFQTLEQYQFSQNGTLSYIIDPNGHETALEYDGDLLTSVQTDCGKLSFSYNEDKLLSKVSDHTGRNVTYEYEQNQLTKATHPSGAAFEYKYVGNGLISEQIDPLGIATVQNEYDSQGRTVVQRMANGGISYLEYDDARMSTRVTEQNGNKIEYFRDSTYRTVRAAYADFDERYIYDTENKRTGHMDRNKNTWWYEFDVHGNTTKKTDPLGNSVIAEYNVFNKPVKLSLQNGGHMGFTYDENGNLTSSIDPIGRVTSVKNDVQGRMYWLMLPDSAQYTLEFDQRGNVIALTDSMGVKTLYEYNLAGMVTRITDFNDAVVEYKYDNIGNLVEIIDPSGVSTTATFDVMQNTTSVTDHNGSTGW